MLEDRSWRNAACRIVCSTTDGVDTGRAAGFSPLMSESFAELFEQSLQGRTMQPGSLINAEVLEVKNDVVIVDAGLKS